MNWLQAFCVVSMSLQLARVLGWLYVRVSHTDTPIGNWLHRGRQRRRLRRWIANGYKPHMDDRR